jgi:iron complex outermembrane receptor protein
MTELIWIQRLTAEIALTGSVYHYRVQDLIDQVRDSSQQLAFVNHERVRARGMELVLDTRPSPATRGYLSFSEQRAVDDDDGDDAGKTLTNSPQRLVKAGFAMDMGPRVSAAGQLTWEAARGTRAGTTTGAVLLANVNLVLRPFPFAEVGIRVANLFDTRYAHPAGNELRQDTIEQDRRTLSLSLTTRF